MIELNLQQVKFLLEMFGGEDTSITIDDSNGELWAWYSEYPEEGCIPLGTDSAQPPIDKLRVQGQATPEQEGK